MSEQPKAVKQKDSGAKSKDISPSKEMHDKYLQFVELIYSQVCYKSEL